jgi:putative membrane protein
MSDGTKAFLQRWFVTTLGVLVAAGVLDGIHANGAVPLLTASLVLGILNALLRPILMIAALPLLILTLGLFTFVINALLLYLVGSLVKGAGFYVADFWSAFKGAILISIVSVIANLMLGKKEARRQPQPVASPPRRPPPNTGSGPVIDV